MLESRKYDHGVQFCQIYWSVLPYVNDAIFGGFSLKKQYSKNFLVKHAIYLTVNIATALLNAIK